MSILLDTNVLSELARPRPTPSVAAWAGQLELVTISVITVDEIFFGLASKPNLRIQTWFEAFFDSECRILDVTAPIARHAGILRGQLTAAGKPRAQADMLIAATAALHGLTVATRNTKDFAQCGIAALNPFE